MHVAPNKISSSYLHALQSHYCNIMDRGICVDYPRLILAREEVDRRIEADLAIASKQWGCKVFIGAANADKDDKTAVNLNATQGERSLLKKLQAIGYHVPKISKKNEEGEYEQKYSSGELALQKMLAADQFGYPGGDEALRSILRVRELGKLKSSYLNASLTIQQWKAEQIYLFLSSYNVAGTLTGRRSSRKHPFGFGNNGQNFPSHSKISGIFRSCLRSRPGSILLSVDQMQAEDWPVSALSNNTEALYDLRHGVDRHSKLASSIFAKRIPAKTDPDWDKTIHEQYRYLGKKTRHARNYGMRGQRMSDSLAQEGIVMSKTTCEALLLRAAQADPSVDEVFHKYVKDCISNDRMLRTPYGRERMFLNARPNADNNTVFNEAYAYIPQSTVGDNTGFAVYELEETAQGDEKSYLVQEGHDSIVQDIPDTIECICRTLERTAKAFDRPTRFYNGIEVNIPIEAELAYDFDLKVSLETLDEKGVRKAHDKLQMLVEKRKQQEVA